MMTASSATRQRHVYSKEFLLRRKGASISQSWPKTLNKQHINGAGLWDPVSYCKQLSKEEKLKRSKRQSGIINDIYQRKRTREVRDNFPHNAWLINSYDGYPVRNNQNVYYIQDEYDVYYESYDNYPEMYDYGHTGDEYVSYINMQSNGRKRPTRPRRQVRTTSRSSNPINGNPNPMNDISEPEWYTSGPTSHIETINLEGLPMKNNSHPSKKLVRPATGNETHVSMDVHSSNMVSYNIDKENEHNQNAKNNNTDEVMNDQSKRDSAGKQLLQLIQNGSQKSSEFPPILPPEVKDATTSAELESALKGLLFKDKDKTTKQKPDELLSKLKAKSHPRHMRVGFYKKCMLNGQVKTVAELEGRENPENKGMQHDTEKSNEFPESLTRGNQVATSDSGDQSAFYRLLGMIKANGNLDELSNTKLRVVPGMKSASNTPDVVDSCKVTIPHVPASIGTKVPNPSQGRLGIGDGDNRNNNSIKDSSTVVAVAAETNSSTATMTSTSTTATTATTAGRLPATTNANRLSIPLPQTGLLRGASNPVAAAAAVASINPMPHPHAVQSHLLPSHMQPHILSAAAHQFLTQHSQQQQQQQNLNQQQQIAALAARYASTGVTPSPYIPPQWLYLAVAQQHAQAQQQSYQPASQQSSHPQHNVGLPNIVGKAASAAAAFHQANSTQQVYRWFRAWSNATAAKVCIKQTNPAAPNTANSIGKHSSSSDDEEAGNVDNHCDVKKTLSESDIRSPVINEENNHLSTHSTPCRRSLHNDNFTNITKQEAVISEPEVNGNRKEDPISSTTRTLMESKSTQSDYSPLRSSNATGSSGFTLVPPQRIAPPMQSSMSAVNNLFRLPPGYSPSLPPSMRVHQTNSNNSDNGSESSGGLGKWFGGEVIGSHRLVGVPQIPTNQELPTRTATVDDIEKR